MMLTVKDLIVTYPGGVRALDGFSLEVAEGENVALIGANGAGKTTLMLALVGVVNVPLEGAGVVVVDGVELSKKTLAEVRRRVGLVFQNPDDQLFMPTVFDDAAFGPRNMGLDEVEAARRVNEALRMLGASRLAERSPLKLSGGEKRLAAIASTLTMNPKILLFDEPTAFLDLKARRNLINILRGMTHTKIIACHDLTFLEETCERTVLIKAGKVFADGKTTEIIRDRRLMEDCDLEGL